MAIDREATLKNAEKLRRLGRVDAAIEEYVRLLGDQPNDWNAAKALGDLYVRAGASDKALPLYARVADHFVKEGFHPKAAALFKKILKITPDYEPAQLRLAEIAAKQGLMADARTYYAAVERQRRDRGDTAGADEIIMRFGELGPEDLDGRLAEAAAAERSGKLVEAAGQYRQLYNELLEQGRENEAASYAEKAADGFVLADDLTGAAAILAEFAARVPTHVPTLLKLVELCLDGGFDEMMFDAQAQLADAYLANGNAAEARVIAEDLVASDPGDAAHLNRLRRALIALGVDNPEGVLAEHTIAALDGESAVGAVAHEPTALEEPAAPSPATARQSPPAHPARMTASGIEFDLTGILGELQGQAPPPVPQPVRDLEEVFAGLRAEALNEADDEARGGHFELARTYLGMGMLQQAIGPLESAARSPRYRFAAASMLSEIRRNEGDLRAAIEWCERAAEVPAPEPEQGRSLLYDLADLLETVGENARALAVFLELASDAPDYRDVRERVAHLSRLETEG